MIAESCYLVSVAVITPLNQKRIHADSILDERWIVDNPATLITVVQEIFPERKADRG